MAWDSLLFVSFVGTVELCGVTVRGRGKSIGATAVKTFWREDGNVGRPMQVQVQVQVRAEWVPSVEGGTGEA